MGKALTLVLSLFIGVAFVTAVFAQTKPDVKPEPGLVNQPAASAPEKTPAPGKGPAPEKKTGRSARVRLFKGDFISMDTAAKTIVARNASGEMTFDVSGVKKMAELAPGDRIMIAYGEKDGKMVARTVAKKAARNSPVKSEAKQISGKEEPKLAADTPAPPGPSTAPAPEKK